MWCQTTKAEETISRGVISTLPILPHSWAWGKLALMTCGVEYGTVAKSASTGDVPVLRMGNIRGGGTAALASF